MSMTFVSSGATPKAGASPENIQKLLQENCNLIQCIAERQAKGNTAECTKFQTQLHRNLVWLATVADSNQAGSGSLMSGTQSSDLNAASVTKSPAPGVAAAAAPASEIKSEAPPSNPQNIHSTSLPVSSLAAPAPVSHQPPMPSNINQGYVYSHNTNPPALHAPTSHGSSVPLDQMQQQQQAPPPGPQQQAPPQQQHPYQVPPQPAGPMQYGQHPQHRPPAISSYNDIHHPPQTTFAPYHQQPGAPVPAGAYNDVMHQPKYPSHQVNYQQSHQQQYQPGQYPTYPH